MRRVFAPAVLGDGAPIVALVVKDLAEVVGG